MKQTRYISIIIAATLFSAACTKESSQSQQRQSVSQITATWAEDQTKTVLGEDGTSILWSPNDEISVFYNGDGVKFTSINSVPKDRTIFRSSYSLIYGGTETSDDPCLYATYPYSTDNAQDGEYLTLTVPAAQTAVEGSFARGAFPSVGRSKDTNIAFYNVCGGIRFTLSQSGIRKIVLKGNGDEILAGKVKVKFVEDGKPEVSAVVSGEKSITLTAPDNGEFQTGKWYYISVLPTALGSGFSVEFIKRTDESECGTRTVSTALQVKRSVFGSVANIDSGVSFEVGVASLSISPENVLVAPLSAVQLSLTKSPSDAQSEITWSSSDKTIATVDEDGMVTGKKDGKCTVTATSDNGKTASCTVYVSQTPVTTDDASGVSYVVATLNGTFNVADAQSVSKTVFFLYSDTETTLEGLKANGTRVETTLSDYDTFEYNLKNLKSRSKYCYVACVSFLDQDYYGEVEDFTTLAYSTPESVDLGLSVKWASFNVGATKPEEHGIYFAWGDVIGQTWNGSEWSGGGFSSYPSYELDDNGNLKPDYDAAHVNLGGIWRMPTKAECQELIDNCTATWTSDYNGTGVAGRIFTSNKEGYTDKSIFLPAAGSGSVGSLSSAGSSGIYWSSTFDLDDYACYLYFRSGLVISSGGSRNSGFSVRPVTE